MAISSVAALVDYLRKLQLVDPTQLEELTRDLQGRFSDSKELARELIKREWLTAYQVNQLARGRGQDLIVGSYVLLGKLGEGGMGEVYKARHQRLGRIVALKLIRKERLGKADSIRRFHREIQAAAKLSHPNVIRAIDADQAGDTHFFTMEFAEGIDLSKTVALRGPLPVAEACEYIRQAALGLQHGVDRGLIHRDIKPSNLLLTGKSDGPFWERTIKVLDMGLALFKKTSEDETSSTLTETGAVMGTPDFVAPEQARNSHEADTRADLYSLGCTLYFLLSHNMPFPGDTLTEKLLKHQLDEPTPLEVHRPGIPKSVLAMVRKLMAKKPADRYQTPGELAAELDEMMPGLIASQCRVGKESVGGTGEWSRIVESSSTEEALEAVAKAGRSGPGRRWLGVATGAALVATGVVIWLLLPGRNKSSSHDSDKPEHAGPVVFRVAASEPWQDSGVEIPKGATLKVSVTGKWRKKQGEECSAEGLEKAPRDRTILSDAPHMCLLGRIGRYAKVYELKPGRSVAVKGSGRLFLRSNDLDPETSAGRLEARIEGGRHTGTPVPPPGPTSIEEAELALKTLRTRLGDAKEDRERLRRDSASFRHEYPGTFQACEAARILMELPAPLDRLDPAKNVAWEGQAAKRPEELVALFGSMRWHHWRPVNAVAFSPDGSRIVSVSRDESSMRVSEIASGKSLAVYPCLNCTAVVFASDETLVLGHATGEVAIFDLAAGQQRHAWKAHEQHVFALELSPDGKTLASSSADGSVRLWEAATGKRLGDLEAFPGRRALGNFSRDGVLLAVRGKQGEAIVWDWKNKKRVVEIKTPPSQGGVAVSPDGKLLAIGDNDTLVVWSVASKKELFSLKYFRASSVQFSPDGKTLAATHEGAGIIRLVDVATWQQRAVVKEPPDVFWDFRYSADGKLMATGNETGAVRLWDADTGKPRRVLDEVEGPLTCLAYSPDGQSLASGEGGAPGFVLVRDPGTGKVRARLKGHAAAVTALCYSSDGKTIASASRDRTIRLWDAAKAVGGATLAPLATLRGHTLAVSSVAFARGDKLLASGGADNTVKVWDLADAATTQTVTAKLSVDGHAGPVFAVAFAPDGKFLASAGADENVIVWDPHSGKKLAVLQGHTGPVRAIAFSRSGWTLASAASIPQGAGAFGEIKLWDVPATGANWPAAAERTFRGNEGAISALAFAPDGYSLVSASDDGHIKLWYAESGQEYGDIRAASDKVAAVSFAPDGTALASAGADGTVKVWDGAVGKPRNPTPGHTALLRAVAFAPDGATLATASADGTVRLWDAMTGRERSILRGHASQVYCIAYSADGKTLASGGAGKTVRLWDAKTGKCLRTLLGDPGRARSLNFSPDGKWLAAADGAAMRLWPLDMDKGPRVFKGHKDEVISVAFHPSSKVLATVNYGERDGIKLWDVDTGKEIGTIQHPYAQAAAFSPNGRELATTGDRGTILWDFPTLKQSRTFKPDMNSTMIAYRHDGKVMALCPSGPLVSLWDTETGIKIKDISVGPLNYAHGVAFSPDGRHLATANTNGTAFIVRVAPPPKQ